jgi:hypothetical protein
VPWRGQPVAPEDTLGFQVADWIEAMLPIPDGVLQGKPYRLTDEMLEFLANYFRIRSGAMPDPGRPSAAFVYRGGQLRRPQKWGKSPLGAALVLAHAAGPVIFDGRNASGEPVGRPAATPWIQIVATAEEQTDNTWMCVYEMANNPRGDFVAGWDIGKLDINLPGGGKIEPRTSSGKSRLGGRITFALFDEPHLMTESSGGVLLATTMKRNLAGMGGRWLETTNAYDPSEGSVAQRTAESKVPDILVDNHELKTGRRPDLFDDEEALAALDYVYGDSWWVDRERILADARDPGTCPTVGDAMRYFFNLVEAGVSDAVDAVVWASQARDHDLQPGQAVGLGFDGSRSRDCTSLVASRVEDGRWFHLRTWNPADYPERKVPREEVDAVVEATFRAYDVRYLYYDPYRWQEYGDRWAGRWPRRVVEFPTNVDKRMDDAVNRFLAVASSTLTHDGDPTLTRHAYNAALAKGARRALRPEEDQAVTARYLKVIKKHEGHHIDAFVAAILAETARGKAIEDGALNAGGVPLVAWV